MTGEKMKRGAILAVALVAASAALAFENAPKASARALGVTRGKSFSSGLVFINGKYLPPPYVVERWGTCIRINGKPVTGQIVDWSEFLKTQSGVKVTKTVPQVATPAPEPVAAPPVTAAEEESPAASLDDLFADTPVVKPKSTAAKAPPKPIVRKPPPPPSPIVSYSLDGDFQPNAASRRLVTTINDTRTSIDAQLRRGGFIFFGDGYSRVSGDTGTALTILEKVPDLLKSCESASAFSAAVRAAGLYYLNDMVCRDIYRNRIDYRALQERRSKWRQERELERMINGNRSY